jgi:hypothetical protein
MNLKQLSKKAYGKGQHQLVAAISAAISLDASLDNYINVVGAAHEVGLLRNSFGPMWAEWRSDGGAWAMRCIERLLGGDHDYWALAALLGLSRNTAIAAIHDNGLVRFALTFYSRFDQPPIHLASYSLRRTGRVIAPVLEIGWDSASLEVVDVRRWRAVVLPDSNGADPTAELNCTGSYYLRAQLPHGGWRIVYENFRIEPSELLEPLTLPPTTV